MKKPKSKSKLKQSLKSNIDKIKTKIKPQLTWFSQLLSTENKAKLKTVWLKVDARYAATPKVDKVVIGSAMVLAMGSVAWAAVPAVGTGTSTNTNQVKVLETGGAYAQQYRGKAYVWGGKSFGAGVDCSGWTVIINKVTAKAVQAATGKNIILPSGGSQEQLTTEVGKRHVVWTKAQGSSISSPAGLPQLKPGMLVFYGPGSGAYKGNIVYIGGAKYKINHVQVVVQIAGKAYVSDFREARDYTTPTLGTSGNGGVNFYAALSHAAPITSTKKGYVVTDPLMEVRSLIGDSATVGLDLNTIESGQTPGQGEIGGAKGLFGQTGEGDDAAIDGAYYMADSTSDGTTPGVSAMLYDLVMGRAASSAWHRGVTLASEPRLLAELAYMKTIQNIMAKARIASVERREALMGPTVGAQADITLNDEAAKQRARVTKGGGN
jgi:cell wall-associated NlpC family hydrolase